MSVEVETLIKHAVSGLGEGPYWEESTKSLLFVDLTDGNVHRWNSITGHHEKISFGTYVGFVIPHSKGGYVAGIENQIIHFQWENHKDGVVLADLEKGQPSRLNDAKCDPRGRLFAGTMRIDANPKTLQPGNGNLYRLDFDGSLNLARGECTISNGLAWSNDHKTMYFIDSRPGYVYAYDYDVISGHIDNERIILDMRQEPVSDSGIRACPDGMTIDLDGNLWIAIYEGRKVIHFDPTSKKIRQEISIPAREITSCCFGGENYEDLYVTSGVFGASKNDDHLAGSLFRIKGLACGGSPAVPYCGI